MSAIRTKIRQATDTLAELVARYNRSRGSGWMTRWIFVQIKLHKTAVAARAYLISPAESLPLPYPDRQWQRVHQPAVQPAEAGQLRA